MKLIAPNYYSKFKCIADKCKHNCCIGWEIDIDDETYDLYRNISGEIGDKLQKNIEVSDDTAYFKLTEKEHCPFLCEDGLCELITKLGKDSLCQVCADHPRFRNYFTSHTEIGLGICCEAAARLILGNGQRVEFITLFDDEKALDTDEKELDFLNTKSKIIEILQNREMSIDERIDFMLKFVSVDFELPNSERLFERYVSLERLNTEWDNFLSVLLRAEHSKPEDRKLKIFFEQLAVYLAFRHINCDNGYSLKAQVSFIAEAVFLIRKIYNMGEFSKDSLLEIARLYSSEIEYSDENLNVLMSQYDF